MPHLTKDDVKVLENMGRRFLKVGKVMEKNGRRYQPVRILRNGFRPVKALVAVE